MKSFVFVGLLSLMAATPVLSQNQAHISRALSGADCPQCNLFQADFTNKTLKNKSYKGARLRQADLSLGTFNGSNFANADMRDVNGAAALFGRVNFSGTNLTHASFVGAALEEANFKGAHLTGVNFSGAEMSTARGLTQTQLNQACGDDSTQLPRGLMIFGCR
jgi:uncharacterized protein YjbI with pentapeptide repeats